MPRLFVYALCSILVAIDVCEAAMTDRRCPNESYVTSEAERLETGGNTSTRPTVVDFRDEERGECPCAKKNCLALCCPIGSVATEPGEPECTAVENASIPQFPRFIDPWASGEHTGQLRIRDFHIFTWNPCPEDTMIYELAPEDGVYNLLANGSIYFPRGKRSIDFTSYCFSALDNDTVYSILLCGIDNILDAMPDESPTIINLFRAADVLSTICSIATFVLYSVLPELRNTHGATVRGYVGTMAVANIANILMWLMPKQRIGKALCIMLAVVENFSSLASFFWLNVMCFDIWCTFGRAKTLQSSVRHHKKKKLTIYSAYAWGTTAFITVISFLMDMVPGVPSTFMSPKFSSEGSCWYTTFYAHVMYYLLPIFVMGFINLCFFISTARKIMQHRKAVASQLNGPDSRRHEENKQELNIYIKLFIMMGLNRSTDILSWFFAYEPEFLFVALDVFAELQGVIVFVVFVWKGKVRRLLLKRLGYGDRRSTSAASRAPSRENSNLDSNRTTSTQEGGCVSDCEHQTEC